MTFKVVVETTFDTREEAEEFSDHMDELDMEHALFTQGFNAVITEVTDEVTDTERFEGIDWKRAADAGFDG